MKTNFFHLNFYSSWCSFFTQFTFHFGLISLLTSFLRRNQFLYESNFSAQLLPITFVDLLAAFLLLEPTSSTKIIRNLINNFFNYLRFFIWTGNFNRHYTSTLMARACDSNDNKTKGFFFFSCRVLAVEYCRRAGWKARLPCLWRYCDVTWDVLLASTVNSSERYKIDH